MALVSLLRPGRYNDPVEHLSAKSLGCTIRAYGKNSVNCEWDPRKAEANFRKHGVRFAEAEPVFEDDFAVTNTDDESDPHELPYITIGTGMKGRVLVVVYCYRGSKNSHYLRTGG